MRVPTQRLIGSLALSMLLAAGAARAAETDDGVRISVENATAKVGDAAEVIARVQAKPGYQIAANYRNAVIMLSAEDKAVSFPSKRVRATVEDGVLVFKVPVVPQRAGPHPINGVLRFAFVGESDGKTQLDIKSAPLIATVTGQD